MWIAAKDAPKFFNIPRGMPSGHFRVPSSLECTPYRFLDLRLSRFTAVSIARRSSNERSVDPRCYAVITITRIVAVFSSRGSSQSQVNGCNGEDRRRFPTAETVASDNETRPRLSEHPVRKGACVRDHYSYRNYNNNYCYYY